MPVRVIWKLQKPFESLAGTGRKSQSIPCGPKCPLCRFRRGGLPSSIRGISARQADRSPPHQPWHRNTARQTVNSALRRAALAVHPAHVGVQFTSRNCIPVNDAGGTLPMFSELQIITSCPNGLRKDWQNTKRSVPRRKKRGVKPDE